MDQARPGPDAMTDASLRLALTPLDDLAVRGLAADALGGLAFAAGAAAPLPMLQVPASQLAPTRALATVLAVEAPVTEGRIGPVHYRRSDEWLFGTLTAAETAPDTLAETTAGAYHAIFTALDTLAFPKLLRLWNYLPDINLEVDGLERYRRFNAGRQAAFEAAGRALTGAVPAACALGTRGGPLCLAFLATHASVMAIENPRQVSAYDYPADYGPKSPTFSRAGLAHVGGQDLLFVSGTAAIVGHHSLHPGDARAQTREIMANLAAVTDAANAALGRLAFALDGLAYTVYLRRAADLAAVADEFHRVVAAPPHVAFIEADICRAELLVEIEASGGHAVERPA
jgi:chorismate lyase / 3-hydroxybenzoate synthase